MKICHYYDEMYEDIDMTEVSDVARDTCINSRQFIDHILTSAQCSKNEEETVRIAAGGDTTDNADNGADNTDNNAVSEGDTNADLGHLQPLVMDQLTPIRSKGKIDIINLISRNKCSIPPQKSLDD